MKKIKLLIFSLIVFVLLPIGVNAESFSFSSSKSSVNKGEGYTVTLNYSGSPIGSATFSLSFSNASCSFSPSNSKMTSNCNGGVCEVTLGYLEGGYKAGKFGTLSCSSASTGTASFTAKVVNGDAWDETGENSITINTGNLNVSIVNPPTTTTTTTKATTRATTTTTRSTTKSTTTVKSSTKKGETTAATTKSTVKTEATTSTTIIVETAPEETTTATTITKAVTTTKATTAKVSLDDLRLSEFKVVGYDVDYDLNKTNYEINVDSDVKELYISAVSINTNTTVEGTGLVNIEDKDSIAIKVKNSNSGNEIEYTININREKKSSFILLIGLFVGGLFVGVIVDTITRKDKAPKLIKEANVTFEPVVASAESIPEVASNDNTLSTVDANVVYNIKEDDPNYINVPTEEPVQTIDTSVSSLSTSAVMDDAPAVSFATDDVQNINGIDVVASTSSEEVIDANTMEVSSNQTVVDETEKIVNTGIIDIPQNESELAQVFSSYNEN